MDLEIVGKLLCMAELMIKHLVKGVAGSGSTGASSSGAFHSGAFHVTGRGGP